MTSDTARMYIDGKWVHARGGALRRRQSCRQHGRFDGQRCRAERGAMRRRGGPRCVPGAVNPAGARAGSGAERRDVLARLIATENGKRLEEARKDAVRAVRVGRGFEHGVQVGPFISAPARVRIHALVEDAVRRGAWLATGGHPLTDGVRARGFFYAPTVLLDAMEEMAVARERALSLASASSPG